MALLGGKMEVIEETWGTADDRGGLAERVAAVVERVATVELDQKSQNETVTELSAKVDGAEGSVGDQIGLTQQAPQQLMLELQEKVCSLEQQRSADSEQIANYFQRAEGMELDYRTVGLSHLLQ